ncbi:rho-associated protein kinase 1 isoform X2 [Drosophila bipectinata]|uniref:rho-associated protein kinase 1 isoform X2 n=1 Tax=Drosophila bipectinata TaxID=42026 RepID=UPI001C89D3E4|nr:myosin-2 heavy chain, non muscle isoform X1 [Drosophila bipectinata]
MTQEVNQNYAYPSNSVQDVARGVEQLVADTNHDLRNFRKEQAHIRAHVNGVLEENQRLAEELDRYKSTYVARDYKDLKDRLMLTNEALVKSRQQVEELRKERRSLQLMQECSQKTIDNMELELKNYRAQVLESGEEHKITQRYVRAVKMLEAKVAAQQEELLTQAETIKALHEHKQRGGEQLQQLQAMLKDQAEEQGKLASLQTQVKEYDLSLSHTRNLLVESTRRETAAVRKAQEAMAISEAANREKAEAEKRAENYREEVTQLATNIGTIMQEAANQVDVEVAQLRSKLSDKDKLIASIKDKLKKDAEEHKSVVRLLETRNNRLEHKYKEALKQNDKLEAEMDVTYRRLYELEKANDSTNESRDCKAKKHYEEQMARYHQAHKEMKTNYHAAMDDITQKFEAEIYLLRKQNSELEADNYLLKSGAAGDFSTSRI